MMTKEKFFDEIASAAFLSGAVSEEQYKNNNVEKICVDVVQALTDCKEAKILVRRALDALKEKDLTRAYAALSVIVVDAHTIPESVALQVADIAKVVSRSSEVDTPMSSPRRKPTKRKGRK